MTLVTDAVPDDRYGMNRIRLATAATAAICAGCFLPTAASATDYCVYPNQSCGANNVQYLQPALDLAAGSDEADRILLGEHAYESDVGPGFRYIGSSPVEIVGAGRGHTVLTSPKNAMGSVLSLTNGDGSSVRDLTVRIPETPAAGFTGLKLAGKITAGRIEVIEAPIQGGARLGAFVWDGAVLEDSTVTLAYEKQADGVSLDNTSPAAPAGVLRGSVVQAGIGVDSWDGGTIERSRIAGGSHAVWAVGQGNTIRDSALTISGPLGAVLLAQTGTGRDTTVTADGVTIFAAPTLPDAGGIEVSTTPDNSRNAELTLTNSIVRGFVPLHAVGTGSGKATLSASYSDYDPVSSAAEGNASIEESHVSNVGDAGFDENTGSDYGLLPTSPLLDRGDPDAPQGLDLNGSPRVADGNGDGIARRDLGASELQPAMAGPPPGGGTSGGPAADTLAPVISGFRSARARLRFAHGTRFRWALSEKARVVVKIQRAPRVRRGRYRTLGALKATGVTGANRLRFSGRIHRRALRPGRYRAVIRAVDAAGNRSTSKTTTFRVMS